MSKAFSYRLPNRTNEPSDTPGLQEPSLTEFETYTLQPSLILMGHRPRPGDITASEPDSQRSWLKIQQGLEALESVCQQRVQLLERTREDLLGIAARIATHIATAGLTGELLPRGYRVLEHENSLYFVKHRAGERFAAAAKRDTELSTQPSPVENSESAGASYLVFSNQSTLFTRMTLKAQPLRTCDLALLCNDLQHGLVDEIAEFVSASLGQRDESVPTLSLIGRWQDAVAAPASPMENVETLVNSLETSPSAIPNASGARRLQLENVGRRGRSRSHKRSMSL